MSTSEQAQKVYEAFKQHLTDRDFKFEEHEDDLAITMIVNGEDLPMPTIVRVAESRGVVVVSSPIPTRIPDEKRMEAAAAVAIANDSILNGRFDLDMSDGTMEFRIVQYFKDQNFNEDTAYYMLAIAFSTVDRFNDRFFMLGKGLMSLEQFIEAENAN